MEFATSPTSTSTLDELHPHTCHYIINHMTGIDPSTNAPFVSGTAFEYVDGDLYQPDRSLKGVYDLFSLFWKVAEIAPSFETEVDTWRGFINIEKITDADGKLTGVSVHLLRNVYFFERRTGEWFYDGIDTIRWTF